MEVKQIKVGLIYPSPMNPRKSFDEESLSELEENIVQQGILQPITVRPVKETVGNRFKQEADKFEIVCGERRYRAFVRGVNGGKIECDEIPCIVREMSDNEAREAMITENLLRMDVDPMEEAAAFAALSEMGQSSTELAERFGKSERFILNRIKLNSLVDEIKKWVTDGKMPLVAAMTISKLSSGNQYKFVKSFGDSGHVSQWEADRFVRDLMCELGHAEWVNDVQWDGARSEGTCKACQCNTENAGCMFYEMKVKEGEGRCTNPSCYNGKLKDYALYKVTSEERLVRNGDKIEFGRVAVVTSKWGGYVSRDDNTKAVITALEDLGYSVFNPDEVFAGRVCYDFDDDRCKEMLERNEAIECISLGGYQGLCVERCLFRVKNSEGNVAADPNSVRRSQLESMIKKAKDDSVARTFDGMKKSLAGKSYFKRVPALSEKETEAMLRLMCAEMGYTSPLRSEAKRNGETFGDVNVTYESFSGQPERIMRAWMAERLSSASAYPITHGKALSCLMMDQYREDFAEIGQKAIKALDKKLGKLNEELERLK